VILPKKETPPPSPKPVALSPPLLFNPTPHAASDEEKHVAFQHQDANNDPPAPLTIDKQSGTSRPSFTITPHMRPIIDKSTLNNFQSGLKTWGPMIDQLPHLLDHIQSKPQNLPVTPQIVFAH
jgi:hypothetical protein